ncbi:MAG: hypothetical protein JW861_01450 [Bacteroidales bacterium]|nr:hypothetical protein [Bacteroidales bacterium]
MLTQIIWFFILPVLIYFTYRLVLIALKKFERHYSGNPQDTRGDTAP